MFSDKEIKDLSKELIKLAENHKFIDLLCIHGSRNSGRATKNSDLDYYIIVNLPENKVMDWICTYVDEETSLEVGEYYHYIFYGIHAKLDGKKVSLHVYNRHVFEERLKNLFSDKFEENQCFARGWIEEATHLFDRKNWFKKFQKYLKWDMDFRKRRMVEGINSMNWFVGNGYDMISPKGRFVAYESLNTMVKAVIDYIYARNKMFQSKYHKSMITDFKKFKPDINKELSFLVEKPNNQAYLKRKINIVKKILEKVG